VLSLPDRDRSVKIDDFRITVAARSGSRRRGSIGLKDGVFYRTLAWVDSYHTEPESGRNRLVERRSTSGSGVHHPEHRHENDLAGGVPVTPIVPPQKRNAGDPMGCGAPASP
jgi:hypothetical protein